MNKRIRPVHPCVDCGKPCQTRSQRCRSCACQAVMKSPAGTTKRPQCLAGENNPNYKGGRCQFGKYIYIYHPAPHPRKAQKRYVAEHILVWEQVHGKPLPKGWVIHHLNGITTDNRPVNLVAMPNKRHYFILAAKAKRIQELEAQLNNQAILL